MTSNNRTPQTVSDLYPSKYVKPADLQGKPVTVHIAKVSVEELRQFDGTRALKVVLTFHKAAKRMILNKTQCLALASITGSERFDAWVGHTITLSPGMAHNGKPTLLISRALKPVTTEEPAQPGHDDLIPVPVPTVNGKVNGNGKVHSTDYRD